MNATLEKIYAKHDRKVLLEQVYVKAGAPIGNTNAAKPGWEHRGEPEHVGSGEQSKLYDFIHDKLFDASGLGKAAIGDRKHLVYNKQHFNAYVTKGGIKISIPTRTHDLPQGGKLIYLREFSVKPGEIKSGKMLEERVEACEALATRIETLLARDSRPAYYDPAQPELHNAVRDRAQAIYQRAVDRSVDYAAAKAAQLAADRKIEAKKKAAIEEEMILLFLMLMADAGEEAFETSTVGLEGVLGEEPEVVPATVLKEFVEQRRAVLSGFPIEMSQRLTRIVTDGIERGQTDREIRSTIAKEASAIKKGQGSVVSLTEAQCTYGGAQCRLLQRAGFETCLWVTQGDEKVRQSHRECEEAGEITIGHEFPNGLRFPGDPQGPASEICGCRCNLIGGRRK